MTRARCVPSPRFGCASQWSEPAAVCCRSVRPKIVSKTRLDAIIARDRRNASQTGQYLRGVPHYGGCCCAMRPKTLEVRLAGNAVSFRPAGGWFRRHCSPRRSNFVQHAAVIPGAESSRHDGGASSSACSSMTIMSSAAPGPKRSVSRRPQTCSTNRARSSKPYRTRRFTFRSISWSVGALLFISSEDILKELRKYIQDCREGRSWHRSRNFPYLPMPL